MKRLDFSNGYGHAIRTVGSWIACVEDMTLKLPGVNAKVRLIRVSMEARVLQVDMLARALKAKPRVLRVVGMQRGKPAQRAHHDE